MPNFRDYLNNPGGGIPPGGGQWDGEAAMPGAGSNRVPGIVRHWPMAIDQLLDASRDPRQLAELLKAYQKVQRLCWYTFLDITNNSSPIALAIGPSTAQAKFQVRPETYFVATQLLISDVTTAAQIFTTVQITIGGDTLKLANFPVSLNSFLGLAGGIYWLPDALIFGPTELIQIDLNAGATAAAQSIFASFGGVEVKVGPQP